MLKSYEEILRLLERLERPHDGFAFLGSDRYLENLDTPVRMAVDVYRDLVFGDLFRKLESAK